MLAKILAVILILSAIIVATIIIGLFRDPNYGRHFTNDVEIAIGLAALVLFAVSSIVLAMLVLIGWRKLAS